jgi:signal transduction histidine kinase
MRRCQLERGVFAPDVERFRSMIDADERHLKRINRLIDDMLDITRIRAERLTVRPEPLEVNAFLADVIERISPQLEAAGCSVSLELSAPCEIRADAYRIEQVVVNVLTKASKYAPESRCRSRWRKRRNGSASWLTTGGPASPPRTPSGSSSASSAPPGPSTSRAWA